MEKRQNTSSESPLPPMCSDKYPYKFSIDKYCLKEQKAISMFLILKISFKGIPWGSGICELKNRVEKLSYGL